MDRFLQALDAAARDMGGRGIGTMGEKTLHLTLKYYFAPDPACHEQPRAGFIADAVTEEGVFEIQTRNLARLLPKLRAFLPLGRVAVVCPVIADKCVIRVDEYGAVLSQRKSPVHQTVFGAFGELYALRSLIPHGNLRFLLCTLALNEYSTPLRKGKYEKLDREPTALRGITVLEKPADYLRFLPPDLPQPFTAADLAGRLHEKILPARAYLNLLGRMGLAEVCGRTRAGQLWSLR